MCAALPPSRIELSTKVTRRAAVPVCMPSPPSAHTWLLRTLWVNLAGHGAFASEREEEGDDRLRHILCSMIKCDICKNLQVMIGTVALIDLCLSNFELLQLPEGETGPLYLYNTRPRHT